MDTVTAFRGEYAFLSNFHRSPMMYDGYLTETAEHAFQAAKSINPIHRQAISDATTPAMAKRLGRSVTLRPNWEEVKLGIMLDIVRTKFASNPGLALMLDNTEDMYLEEGNTWGDTYWGTVRGMGDNHLGHILMRVRWERSWQD